MLDILGFWFWGGFGRLDDIFLGGGREEKEFQRLRDAIVPYIAENL